MIQGVSETTTISLWAIWVDPAMDWVIGAGNYDLNASETGWVAGAEVDVLEGPASSVGVLAGASYTGASNGQLHIPIIGFIGVQDNPILYATYEWTTTDFTIRTIDLTTSGTFQFQVAEWGDPFGSPPTGGRTFQLWPDDFTPGSGSFEVIPAPSALALLGLGGLVALRRRR
ncbi:MAG: PEP-CTERM sorting domain-containing protein [Planctomycetes bacterium]|nr:PEP-CTERM sorting domain-containing protein [Planctomycetota bacterium]